MYLREAAESLFESANLDDDKGLNASEMRNLMRQMLGKKLLKKADIIAQLRSDHLGNSAQNSSKVSMKRNSSKFGQRLKSFFGERSIKVQSLVDKRIAREAKRSMLFFKSMLGKQKRYKTIGWREK